MTDEILDFATNVLRAAGPVQSNRTRRDDGVALGSVTIPGAQRVVPQIIAFGRNGGVFKTGRVNVTLLGQPRPAEEHLEVGYRITVENLAQSEGVTRIPYPNAFARDLCHGKWVRVGIGELHMTPEALAPWVTPDGDDGVLIAWDHPPTIRAGRRLFRWLTNTTIRGIRINQSGGEILVGNPITGFFLPQLVWG